MSTLWTELTLTDSNGQPARQELRKLLSEWRKTDSIYGWFFAYGGEAWEDKGDPSTWGPESPDDIDWTGFESQAGGSERG